MTVSEVAWLTLKSGIGNIDESQLWLDSLKTISRQPGFQGAFYGLSIEDSAVLELLIDWESLQDHQRFMTTPEYKPFLENLGTILASPAFLCHFQASNGTSSDTLARAPVVEMATIYGISDLSTYTSAVEKFIENTKPVAAGIGFQGAIFGPVIEDIAKDGENVKGSAFKLCIGWTSIEAHMRFRETDAFKKNIHLLREGSTGAALHHTTFKKY